MKEKQRVRVQELDQLDLPDVANESSEMELGLPALANVMPPELYIRYTNKKFRLLREAKERVKSLLLEPETWNVLWQIDGRRTVQQISENLNLSMDVTVYHVETLKLMGIVCASDAVFLPEFILEKTEKIHTAQYRRKTDNE